MMKPEPLLSGLVPDNLKVRSARILLDSLEVSGDQLKLDRRTTTVKNKYVH